MVEGPGTDRRFVDQVVAAVREWDLEPIVLGTPRPGTAVRLGHDVVDASGAAALARALERRLGTQPEWDVRPATDRTVAVIAHARAVGAGMVAVAHAPHGGRSCPHASLAVRLDGAVLLA